MIAGKPRKPDDTTHDYSQGQVEPEFVERLLLFCTNPVFITMGSHECEFCEAVNDSGGAWEYGSGEIWVFGSDLVHYVAPDMIHHYVIIHQYHPPEEFIQAVLACPLPDTPEYQNLVKQAR